MTSFFMRRVISFIGILGAMSAVAQESTYLGNNQRTGYFQEDLPANLSCQWIIEEAQKPIHAWKDPYYMQQYIDFDYADQTCIAYGKVFFGSSADGTVRAVSQQSGELIWSFHTEAAVRFAPVAYHQKIYFSGDDGFVYCVNESDGSLVWKLQGAPKPTKCVGNDRILSRWPMRSGVLIEGDKLYTTVGMWSRDGVFIYCLDPETGEEIWKNDTSGFHYSAMPHASGFGGVAPQGPLACADGMLYVPMGRAAPAFFNADTGAFVSHENGLGYKTHYPGGSWVMKAGDWLVFKRRQNRTETDVRTVVSGIPSGFAAGLIFYNWKTGAPEMAWTAKNMAVVNGKQMVLSGSGPVIKIDFDAAQKGFLQYGDLKKGTSIKWDPNILQSDFDNVKPYVEKWAKAKRPSQLPSPALMSPVPFSDWSFDAGRVYSMAMTDSKVILGCANKVIMLDLLSGDKLWEADVKGDARGITITKDQLLVSTTEGVIYSFAAGKNITRTISMTGTPPTLSAESVSDAKKLLELAGRNTGYTLVLGASKPETILALLQESSMVISCLTDDETEHAALTSKLEAAGYLGTRAQVLMGNMEKPPFMRYLFNTVLTGGALGRTPNKLGSDAYEVLRPYDGRLIYSSAEHVDAIATELKKVIRPADQLETTESALILTRGKIQGSGEWTQPFANMGRTSNSQDEILKAPLGVLWWGGPGPRRIMSRHWVSPVPLFTRGFLFIQGQHDVIGVDAYNGREMWNRHLPDVGRIPMPIRGGNIVADQTHVYALQGLSCLALDHETGATTKTFTMEPTAAELKAAESLGPVQFRSIKAGVKHIWEYLGVTEDTVIGTLGIEPVDLKKTGLYDSPFQSKTIFAFDKKTGKKRWTYQMDRTVQPVAMVADESRLYVLDRTAENVYLKERRTGKFVQSRCTLKAIDLQTGKPIYETKNLPMKCKSLMLSDGVIITLPSPNEKDVYDALNGITAFNSHTGKILWTQEDDFAKMDFWRRGQQGYYFISDGTLYTPRAYDLKTGKEQFLRKDPLTGKQTKAGIYGINFCGGVAASKTMAVYRSSSIGYTDLSADSGSFWVPEIRSSCWVSLLPVGGMLLSPEGTASCTCSYSYKTCVALVPVERKEDWSIHLETGNSQPGILNLKKRIPAEPDPRAHRPEEFQFLRINFGAPGDFYDRNEKQLWLSWPKKEMASHRGDFKADLLPLSGAKHAQSYHYNADYTPISGTQNAPLFLTGLEGNMDLDVKLIETEADYEIRFLFAEVSDAKPGERVFTIFINDQPVVKDLDIAEQTGGTNRALISAPIRMTLNKNMKVRLEGASELNPLIAGIEIIRK